MKNITLIDTTLRDGVQAPDTLLTAQDRLNIMDALYRTGLTEIEAGIPAMGDEECSIISSIVKKYPSCHISSWCRAKQIDVDAAARTGSDTVHISFPVSDIHLGVLKKNQDWLFDTLSNLIKYASSSFARISVGCQDATRAPMERLVRFSQIATSCGAFRVRLADTVGIYTPIETAELIKFLSAKVPSVEFEFHAHNDMGMATANAVTALQSGASAVSVTVNGIGERAGNAALEEVAIAISRSSHRMEHGLTINRLFDLCKLVSGITGKPIAANKPVVGDIVFTHESGIHCHALSADSTSYEPFDPASVGHAPSKMVAGSHSGTTGILNMLRNTGIDAERETVVSMLPVIKKEANRLKRSLLSNEIKKLYGEILKSK